MAGIIEDHEARLQVLEAVRRGINSEITAQITKFAADLEGQSRRLTTMEANHTGLQHNEIAAMGRRVHAVEVNTVTTLDKVALDQQALGIDVKAWIAELKDACDHNYQGTNEYIRTLNDAQSRLLERTRGLSDRVSEWEAWLTAQTMWNEQPWWRRWWRRLRGEQP